jgi:hypothetical protein
MIKYDYDDEDLIENGAEDIYENCLVDLVGCTKGNISDNYDDDELSPKGRNEMTYLILRKIANKILTIEKEEIMKEYID